MRRYLLWMLVLSPTLKQVSIHSSSYERTCQVNSSYVYLVSFCPSLLFHRLQELPIVYSHHHHHHHSVVAFHLVSIDLNFYTITIVSSLSLVLGACMIYYCCCCSLSECKYTGSYCLPKVCSQVSRKLFGRIQNVLCSFRVLVLAMVCLS